MYKNLTARIIAITVFTIIMSSCSTQNNQDQLKKEILDVETRFMKTAISEGVSTAFVEFADNNAVIQRNNKLIIGKDAIRDYYGKLDNETDNSQLTWEPSFVEVSESGDLAYTWGYYKYTIVDSLNNKNTSHGVFHTVWKRQIDGSWKYVWD